MGVERCDTLPSPASQGVELTSLPPPGEIAVEAAELEARAKAEQKLQLVRAELERLRQSNADLEVRPICLE